jgi:hypothetical protein
MLFALAGLLAGTASAVSEKTVTWLSPESDVGQRHIFMYNIFTPGSDDPVDCLVCHSNPDNNPGVGGPLTAPFLSFKGVNHHEGRACISCHRDGLFLFDMGNMSDTRCEDCHEVSKRRTESKNARHRR